MHLYITFCVIKAFLKLVTQMEEPYTRTEHNVEVETKYMKHEIEIEQRATASILSAQNIFQQNTTWSNVFAQLKRKIIV